MAPKTLQQAVEMFSDPQNVHDYLVASRWPNGVVCPTCGSPSVKYSAVHRRWQCASHHARRQFTLKTGTIFEDSPLPLGKWLIAGWMLANCRNGVSSYELQRTIGVTQKTAWFMLHRIRAAMKLDMPPGSMGGPGGAVEVDETYVGPNPQKMHRGKRLALAAARSEIRNVDASGKYGKTAVQGILDRDSRMVRAAVLPNTKREALQAAILEHVAKGSRIFTDEHVGYQSLPERQYVHQMVNHMERYVDGRIHTNGLENFWSLFKRMLRGTYVAVEPFHLERYADEQAFRYNHRKRGDRKLTEAERLDAVTAHVVGRRVTYRELTGKEGETADLF